jgi:methylated-DNA-protein-cysteine methyltransferase-like protein
MARRYAFRRVWARVVCGGVQPGPFAVAVLDAVERIPPGRVMSYGDIAEYVGHGTARMVGRVLAVHGHEVPWHRVLRADGTSAPQIRDRQLALLRAEGVPIRGDRVDMAVARYPSP